MKENVVSHSTEQMFDLFRQPNPLIPVVHCHWSDLYHVLIQTDLSTVSLVSVSTVIPYPCRLSFGHSLPKMEQESIFP
jgi:hypothetical protein